MRNRKLILGSGSPQRRRLMEDAGYDFEIVVPRDSAERGICSNCGPAELVTELAVAKAVDVAEQLGDSAFDATIITCDTVAECGGQILGKPADEDHARGMLEQLRNTRHRVYSGLCVWRLGEDRLSPRTPHPGEGPGRGTRSADNVRLAVSELRMDPIDHGQIEEYLASSLWRGKAGALGYQDRVGWLHLETGSESNVIGLPMELLAEMLKIETERTPKL